MNVLTKVIGAVVLGLLLFCLIAVLMALPVMWLWNAVIPTLFPGEGVAHHIGFWTALGLALLCSFLFKSSSSSSK